MQQSVESEYDAQDISNEDETYTGAAVRETKTTRPIGKPQSAGASTDRRDSRGSGKGASLGDRLNAIAKSFSNNATDVAPGMYEAVISEGVVQQPDAKGQSVRLKFELCDEEFKDKNQIAQWFRIFDEDGEPFEPGIRSLAYNFAKLGSEVRFEGDAQEETCQNLQEQLDDILKDKPGIIAKVTNNEYKGRTFTNVSVEKTCDNEVVQAYKDNVAF